MFHEERDFEEKEAKITRRVWLIIHNGTSCSHPVIESSVGHVGSWMSRECFRWEIFLNYLGDPPASRLWNYFFSLRYHLLFFDTHRVFVRVMMVVHSFLTSWHKWSVSKFPSVISPTILHREIRTLKIGFRYLVGIGAIDAQKTSLAIDTRSRAIDVAVPQSGASYKTTLVDNIVLLLITS